MLDMHLKLFLIMCIYMDHQDLQALATSLHFLCDLLLLEYLCHRSLVLKDTSARGVNLVLYDLGEYTSLGLWSVVHNFYHFKDIYSSIPHNVQEVQSVMEHLIHFLQDLVIFEVSTSFYPTQIHIC